MKKISLLTILFLTISAVNAQIGLHGQLKDKIKPCDPRFNELVLPSPNDSLFKYHAKIWPNPSFESFNLEVESPSKQSIKILISDLMGKKVEEFLIGNTASLSFGTAYSPGLYIIRIKQGSEIRSTFKLIKQ